MVFIGLVQNQFCGCNFDIDFKYTDTRSASIVFVQNCTNPRILQNNVGLYTILFPFPMKTNYVNND